MDRENPLLPIFSTDNDATISDTDIMRSYAIDTLFDSMYYTGDMEEIETADALRAPDSEEFIAAIRKEVHIFILETRTLQPFSRIPSSEYSENTATSASGRSEQRLNNASGRRSPMASRISRRLERRPAETHFAAP